MSRGNIYVNYKLYKMDARPILIYVYFGPFCRIYRRLSIVMDENCEINFEFDNMIHISIDNIYKLFLSFKAN